MNYIWRAEATIAYWALSRRSFYRFYRSFAGSVMEIAVVLVDKSLGVADVRAFGCRIAPV